MLFVRHGLGGLLAIALAAAPMPVMAAAPASASERGSIVRASLSIDTSALGGAAEGVKERIRVRGEALLRSHDVLPARGADDPVIAITVEPLGSEPGYRCAFAVRRADEVIAGTEGTSLCQLCTEDELVDHLEGAIDRVVPQVPASTTSGPTTSQPTRGRAVPPPSPRRPELRALGKGGLATAIAGSVLVGVGVGLAAKPLPAGDEEPTGERVAGIVIASVAVPLLIAGLAMVVIDVRRGRTDAPGSSRAQKPGRRSAWRISPTAGRGGGGMLVRARF